jgi:hypothetical protein
MLNEPVWGEPMAFSGNGSTLLGLVRTSSAARVNVLGFVPWNLRPQDGWWCTCSPPKCSMEVPHRTRCGTLG